MPHRIHIFGASGSGASTLGAYLAEKMGGLHLDTDSYYWQATDPPFTKTHHPAERVAMIERDIRDVENWVLSGSVCSWGDPLLHRFTLAVFLHLDPVVRMGRIADRERERYGPRILPGADMHKQHLEFMEWAASYDYAKAPIRSFDLHERWMKGLECPIIRLDSNEAVETLCSKVLEHVSA
jgi:adenylate kinase family enzyme